MRGRAGAAQPRSRETPSLEAYRAFTEGWLQLETLDVREIPRAIANFERAIAADRALRAGVYRAGQRRARRLRGDARATTRRRSRCSTAPSRTRAQAVALDDYARRSARDAGADPRQRVGHAGARSRRRAAPSRSSRELAALLPARPRDVGRRAAARGGEHARALSGFRVRALSDGHGPRRARTPGRGRNGAAAGRGRPGSADRSRRALSRRSACTGCSASCAWRRTTRRKRSRNSSASGACRAASAVRTRIRDARRATRMGAGAAARGARRDEAVELSSARSSSIPITRRRASAWHWRVDAADPCETRRARRSSRDRRALAPRGRSTRRRSFWRSCGPARATMAAAAAACSTGARRQAPPGLRRGWIAAGRSPFSAQLTGQKRIYAAYSRRSSPNGRAVSCVRTPLLSAFSGVRSGHWRRERSRSVSFGSRTAGALYHGPWQHTLTATR